MTAASDRRNSRLRSRTDSDEPRREPSSRVPRSARHGKPCVGERRLQTVNGSNVADKGPFEIPTASTVRTDVRARRRPVWPAVTQMRACRISKCTSAWSAFPGRRGGRTADGPTGTFPGETSLKPRRPRATPTAAKVVAGTTRNAPTVARDRLSEPRNLYSRSRAWARWRVGVDAFVQADEGDSEGRQSLSGTVSAM